MENQFEVKQEGTVLTIVLGTELATSNAAELMEEISKYRDQGVEKVVFDATQLAYIASSGIRVIIFAKQKLGGTPEIEFVNCPQDIYSLFELTGIHEQITFVNRS